MTTTFFVRFKEHVSPGAVANLKGILLDNGIARDEGGLFIVEVTRESRVSFTAIQLNNWTASGWLTWTSDPTLEPENSN